MSRNQNQGTVRFTLLVAFALALSASLFAFPAEKPAEGLPAGEMQATATTSCLECHEARIIVQQRLSKAAWTREVDKMTKWGAVVAPSDHDALIDYLSANFGTDTAPYEPARTVHEGTGQSSANRSTKK